MAIIKQLMDVANNLVYPKTVTKAVYDAETNERLDTSISNMKEDISRKINTNKIIASNNITESGYLMDGKTVSDHFTTLDSRHVHLYKGKLDAGESTNILIGSSISGILTIQMTCAFHERYFAILIFGTNKYCIRPTLLADTVFDQGAYGEKETYEFISDLDSTSSAYIKLTNGITASENVYVAFHSIGSTLMHE